MNKGQHGGIPVKHRNWVAGLGSATIALAVFVAACGGDDDDGDDGNGNTPPCTPVAAGEAVIDQDNLKFSPSQLCVAQGQQVLFKNSESAIHTVTIEGENLSGTMREDDEFRWTPPGTGEYDITCDFHPQMKARVTVSPPPGSE